MLLINSQQVEGLAQFAERIRRSLRSPIKIAGKEVVLTGSIGNAIYDGEEAGSADLLKKSQIAMYRARRAGADRSRFYTPDMRADLDEERAAEADLRRALEKGQFKIFYKPVIYLPTEELAGFEAAIRWEHPSLGLVDPMQFVPQDPQSDLAIKIASFLTPAGDAQHRAMAERASAFGQSAVRFRKRQLR